MNRIFLISLLSCAVFLGPPSVLASVEEATVNAADEKAPLKVTADRMVSDQNKGVIEFTGSVDAVKGSLRVVADKVLVFTEKEGNDFTHIKAIGSVRISRGGKIATGDEGDYFRDRSTLILTGSPTLDDGKSVATGEKVIYNFKTEEMTLLGGSGVEGQNGRATVTLFDPDQSESGASEEVVTEKAPLPTSTPAPTAKGDYTVQVAAFRDSQTAHQFAQKLRSKGYPDTWVASDTADGKPVHRVRVGRFTTQEEAKTLEATLRQDEKIDGFTLHCENGCD